MNLVARNLSKTYPGGIHALRDVNLELGTGMFGLLGPNGAGKSTFMNILATLETPSQGSVTVDGIELVSRRREVRAALGYLPQFFGVYPQLTGQEFLTYMARLGGVPRAQLRQRVRDLLHSVGLDAARDRKVKTYSGGMVRRLGIAQALVADPRLLIVDEPTVGLDPEERIRFRNLLTEISRDKTIILSTHIVADISSTCDDLALLSRGRVVYRGHPAALVEEAAGRVWQVLCEDVDFSRLAAQLQIISTIPRKRQLLLRVVGDPLPGYDMHSVPPNLEDAYMHFMAAVAGERLQEEDDAQA